MHDGFGEKTIVTQNTKKEQFIWILPTSLLIKTIRYYWFL